MKEHLKSVLALFVICAVTAVLMAATNAITAPIIEKNEASKANEALLVVMPNGSGFELCDISDKTLPATVREVYKEANGGYVVKLETAGYSTGMVILVGVDANGTVTGATCLGSSETLGYEKTYGENFAGKALADVEAVDTVGGATKTTGAYKNAVKDAINTATIMGGGSVDIRTPEQILQDNLVAALPEGTEFGKVFVTEVIEGIDEIYIEANGKGYVYVIGESFYGVDINGYVISEADEATKTAITTAHGIWSTSVLTEIDITGLELPSQILKASATSTGNYVFELRASGFGINGDEWYKPSGEYIYISVAVTPEGKIISTLTTAQAETEGIGDACASPEFYTQFNGKDKDTYKDIDAISGATYTTNGYKTAIGKVFEALEILKGGAN